MTEAAARRGALFDVGYTLMDEWPRVAAAAEWFSKRLRRIGVRTSPAALERLYAEACRRPRQMNALVQTLVDLGIDEVTAWAVRGDLPWDRVPLEPYPDALPALRRLKAAGFRIGVLANQPASAGRDLERAGLAALADGVWLSEEVGVAKPDPAFFALALGAWGLQPPSVAYVGDRPDADVRPARGLGLYTVRVLRGPHANQKPRDRTEQADVEVPTLQEAARRLLAWASQRFPPGP